MYITEAANATTFYSRLTMLLSAVEAFAGEINIGKTVVTNHEAIKAMLGNELHEKLYKYGTGLRNKLLHGNFGAHHLFDGLSDQVYNKIRTYLRESFDVQMNEDVVDPQRNFHENFQSASMFMKFNDPPNLDLKEIEIAVDDDNPERVEKEREIFTYYSGNPDNY
jgi:hypothetical protein